MQIIFFKYILIIMSDIRLHITPDRMQHWMKVLGVQTDRFWLFGIFHYILI